MCENGSWGCMVLLTTVLPLPLLLVGVLTLVPGPTSLMVCRGRRCNCCSGSVMLNNSPLGIKSAHSGAVTSLDTAEAADAGFRVDGFCKAASSCCCFTTVSARGNTTCIMLCVQHTATDRQMSCRAMPTASCLVCKAKHTTHKWPPAKHNSRLQQLLLPGCLSAVHQQFLTATRMMIGTARDQNQPLLHDAESLLLLEASTCASVPAEGMMLCTGQGRHRSQPRAFG